MSYMRINKYLSENSYCSRREADRLVEAGRVFINGKRAALGDQVSERDVIRVEGRDQRRAPEKIYLLVNKPAGVVVSMDSRKKNNIIEFIDFPDRVFPIGYLEKSSEGLLMLTNDKVLFDRMMNPRFENEQEFVVEVDKPLDMKDIGAMQRGVLLSDGTSLPAKVRMIDDFHYAIIPQEMRPQYIRRLGEALGYRTVSIRRTRLLTLKIPMQYPVGNWRHLTDSEIRELKRMIGMKS